MVSLTFGKRISWSADSAVPEMILQHTIKLSKGAHGTNRSEFLRYGEMTLEGVNWTRYKMEERDNEPIILQADKHYLISRETCNMLPMDCISLDL